MSPGSRAGVFPGRARYISPIPWPRALAADIEGTLTDKSGRRTSAQLVGALRRLEVQGVLVILCSGRGVEYQRTLRRRWGLSPEAPLVAENGCSIFIGGREILTYRPTGFRRDKLLKRLQAMGVGAVGELDPEKRHAITVYPRGFMKGGDYTEEDIDRICDFLRKALRGVQCRIFRTSASGEVLPAGTDKGRGLRLLLRELRIPPLEVLFIGDGQNDVPAARFVKRAGGKVGVPANATGEMRALADYVSRGAFYEGALEILEAFFNRFSSQNKRDNRRGRHSSLDEAEGHQGRRHGRRGLHRLAHS
ncbi:MAG: HAD-IIB family hydrolase [Thermoplasmata archaeon]